MSEADAVARSTGGPVTLAWLKRDLGSLGVKPGMLLMVHASLSRLGWVVGGAVTVVQALRAAVGEEGTLALPTFSASNTDPGGWRYPPVPEAWWETIRAEMPPYDPATTPARGMGAVAAYFRHLPGVLRSDHPVVSWAAQGPLAAAVTQGHELSAGQGEGSPQGRCYELGGHVLSLGCRRTSVLHLAEHRAQWPGKHSRGTASAVLAGGQRRWETYQMLEGDDGDFEQLRQDYMHASADWAEGPVGYGTARLFPIRALVDFAAGWLSEHRR